MLVLAAMWFIAWTPNPNRQSSDRKGRSLRLGALLGPNQQDEALRRAPSKVVRKGH
jgi:hypothetical protein